MSDSVGTVVAVCLGPGGIPKTPVAEAVVKHDGLLGDAHRSPRHGGLNRAVCIFSVEDQVELLGDGVPCAEPGSFGENVLVEGLDFGAIRPGDLLSLGDQVRLEIHDVRAPCGTLKSLDKRFPDLLQGRNGFVCRVACEGRLSPGMDVRVIEEPEG